jgi:predicted nucleotidyltransferase
MVKGSSNSVKVFYPHYNQAELVALLRERLPALATALPLKRVLLFGSWAVGKATAFSDIDLMVIYADPPREDAYQVVRRSLKLRGLEPHVYSEQQANAMRVTLERMTERSIVLFPDDNV